MELLIGPMKKNLIAEMVFYLMKMEQTIKNTRGGSLGGVQIHSARMPGRVARHELVFGGLGQTFTMLHDSIDRQSFMPGVVLGVKEIVKKKELVIGLDKIMGI